LAETIAEATVMGAYRWDRFKTTTGPTGDGRPVPRLEDVTIVEADGGKLAQIRRGLDRGSKIAEAVNYTRDLGNSPPNEMTPAALADHARKLGDQHAMVVEVLTVEDLKQQGMGGILGVGQGSHNGPRLIIVRYDRGRPSAKPTILVGKAITFDAGGISIKPSRHLEEMKFDKMGGCAVLGILKAAALLGLKQSLIGVIPAAENLPSAAAYRPGDILEFAQRRRLPSGGHSRVVLRQDDRGYQHRRRRAVDPRRRLDVGQRAESARDNRHRNADRCVHGGSRGNGGGGLW
jgi:leucyl aminopeptidase